MYEFVAGAQAKMIGGDTTYDGNTRVSFAKDVGTPVDTDDVAKQSHVINNLNFLYSGGFGCMKESNNVLKKINILLEEDGQLNDNQEQTDNVLGLDDLSTIYGEDMLAANTRDFIETLLNIPKSQNTEEDANEVLGIVLNTILSSIDTQNIPDKYNVTKR